MVNDFDVGQVNLTSILSNNSIGQSITRRSRSFVDTLANVITWLRFWLGLALIGNSGSYFVVAIVVLTVILVSGTSRLVLNNGVTALQLISALNGIADFNSGSFTNG